MPSEDAFGRYTGGGGRPIPEMGHTTPGVEYQESERFGVGLMPAPYLPCARFDDHKRANIVLSAGVPVSLDERGSLIPAGIPESHVFTYTALDFTTGLGATRSAATGAAIAAAGNAAMHSGLLPAGFAAPVGVMSYNAFAHEGGVSYTTWPTYTLTYDNPLNYSVHNTMAQDLVAITLDYMIQVPYIYGKNLLGAATKMFPEVSALTATAKSYPFAHDELTVDTAITSSTAGIVHTFASGTMTNMSIVYVSPNCGLGDDGVPAEPASFGTLASGATGWQFTAPGGTAGAVVTHATYLAQGDHILYDGTDTSKYIVVRTVGTGAATYSTASIYFNFELGDQLKPGDFVVARAGRYIKFNNLRHERQEILGQVVRRDDNVLAKDYLNRVKTGYENSSVVSHRMAGSATRGVPYLLSQVTDAAQVLLETSKDSLNGTAITPSVSTLPLSQVVINLLR